MAFVAYKRGRICPRIRHCPNGSTTLHAANKERHVHSLNDVERALGVYAFYSPRLTSCLRPSAHSRPPSTSSAACTISLCLCAAIPLDRLGLMLRVGVTQTDALVDLYSWCAHYQMSTKVSVLHALSADLQARLVCVTILGLTIHPSYHIVSIRGRPVPEALPPQNDCTRTQTWVLF
jgi:hypothetical protein